MKRHDTLLIIPAYNEEKNIGAVLQNLEDQGITAQMDVLIIDDGSKDNTAQIAAKYDATVLSQIFNLGYGAALQTGYKYAVAHGYAYLLQMDADGQHDLRSLDRLLQRLRPESPEGARVPDIVIGSRFLEGSESFPMSWLKMFAIRMFRGVIRSLTGYRLTDPTSGLQGLNRKAFSYYAGYLNFDLKYPDLNMVIQMLLLGFHIEETPAIMHARKEGVSMHTGLWNAMMYMIVMALSTFNAFLRFRRHRKKEGRP